jgi:hypothetical protein
VTDRIPLDHLTSDQLDALYEQLEAAEETEAQQQLATAREAFASTTARAARAEVERARAAERMAVYRAAWHSARGRATHQRCINADLRTELAAKANRAEQAQAAIARVRALHREEYGCCAHCTRADSVLWPCPTIRALDKAAPDPAATQAGCDRS